MPEIYQNVKNYVSAVHCMGADCVIVTDGIDERLKLRGETYLDIADFSADRFDALMLPGGVDVNPKRYGQTLQGSCDIRNRLDDLQFAVLDAFVRQGKPVFGICRGHQIINVYFGGSLIQDIGTSSRHARNVPALTNPDKVHGAYANNGSWLARLYGTMYLCNSAHHQGVDVLGEDLEIDSRCCDDGIVEALHHRTLPIWGVQWHPERMCFGSPNPQTVCGEKVLRFFLKQVTDRM